MIHSSNSRCQSEFSSLGLVGLVWYGTGMKKQSPKNKGRKTGPKPDIVKIDGNWENAVWKALKKERPKEGWPKPKK